MSIGLVALLDDITALAKLAAASVDDVGAAAGRASVKAAGVVVDDTAVTPRYTHGLEPQRELPIIRRIALGSLRNKLVFILPGALLFSQIAPWLLTPLLMLGGTYLCFEGAEKVIESARERFGRHARHSAASAEADAGADGESQVDAAGHEQRVVSGAIRTDFILSAEIMVISLGEVAHEPLLSRAVILVIVAFVITALVYGVVAVIVKMDDVGLHLAGRSSPVAGRIGRLLVAAMPRLLYTLAVIGTIAMLWVGGHILISGLKTLGFTAPATLVHHLAAPAEEVAGVGTLLGWLVDTGCSAVAGLLVGAVLAGLHLLGHGLLQARHARRDQADRDARSAAAGDGTAAAAGPRPGRHRRSG